MGIYLLCLEGFVWFWTIVLKFWTDSAFFLGNFVWDRAYLSL